MATETTPTETVKTDTKAEKPKVVRVSGNVSPELYDALYNDHRFEVRKDKGEFLEFILTEYATANGIKF